MQHDCMVTVQNRIRKFLPHHNANEPATNSFTGADPAIGGPDGRLPLGLGSAPWENCATPLSCNTEFTIIIIWGRFSKKIEII